MTTPDYEEMTRKELKEYLLVNRNDKKAWSIFFEKLNQLDRSKSYPPPQKMSSNELEAIFRSKTGF